MCGRFVTTSAENLEQLFEPDEIGDDLPEPGFNVAPTDPIAIIVDSTKDPAPGKSVRRRLEAARWGLVPSFAKDVSMGARMFNARVESVLDKPAFRTAAKSKRAIIPAVGYYEWTKDRQPKVPFFLHPDDDALLAFAGLYSWWADPAKAADDPDRWVLSATIITRPSEGHLAGLHDRMPLMLPPALWDRWLDPAVPADQPLLDEALGAGVAVAAGLDLREVDRAVGNVRNQGPHLLDPIPDGIVISADDGGSVDV